MFDLVLLPYDPRRDLEDLLQAYADPTEQAQFANHAPVNDLRAFDEWLTANLRSSYRDFRVARDRASGRFAGFAHSYDARPLDGHCKICVYVTPELRAAGGGGWLAVAFMGELFKLYPLRKIYTAVYEYNGQSLHSCCSAGFEEEGRLRAYRYYDGAYHDCVMMALTRERYYEHLFPLLNEGFEGGAGLAAARAQSQAFPGKDAETDGRPAAGGVAGAVKVVVAPFDPDAFAQRVDVAATVAEVVANVYGSGDFDMEARLVRDLGFDSFDMLAVLSELEDELCVALDANIMKRSATVADLCAAVRKEVAA